MYGGGSVVKMTLICPVYSLIMLTKIPNCFMKTNSTLEVREARAELD